MDISTILLKLLAVMCLIVTNGFFVAAEFAMVSVRTTRIDQLVEEGNPMARLVQRAKLEPTRFLSATQIGITFASLALGWLAEPTIANLLLPIFLGIPGLGHVLAHTLAALLAFFLISYVNIVLGELIPKALALQRTEPVAFLTAWPMRMVSIAATPFIMLLNASSQTILGIFGIEKMVHGHHLVYSEDELKRIVNASHEVGILEADEQAMLHKVFAFSDRVAREVMVPRPDMQLLPVEIDWDDLLLAINTHAHTRYPVYEDNIDNVIGVFHIKDLFAFLSLQRPDDFAMRPLIREVAFVPENKAVDDLLTELRKGKAQIAIVMDEFGGTAGLITLEDLLEEIVGEIEDEFDLPENDVERLSTGNYSIDGGFRIADFNERFNAELSTDDFDTMAGLIFGQLGRDPQLGDEVAVERFYFRIKAIEGHRITRLELCLEESGTPKGEAPDA